MPLVTPPRYETQAATDNLNSLLHLWGEGGEPDQDWQFIVEDSERVAEFCDLYESGTLDTETKFALMMLIVSSLDDASHEDVTTSQNAGMPARVDRLLRQDFLLHFHTIHYWSLLDEDDPENVFPVTPMLRSIWADCFKPEYQSWLEWDLPPEATDG